jgi:prevent-host-death family protein
MIFTAHQAKTQLSKLIASAEAGDEVIIALGNTPVVRLTPIEARKTARIFGAYRGAFEVSEAFIDPHPDEDLALWSGAGD